MPDRPPTFRRRQILLILTIVLGSAGLWGWSRSRTDGGSVAALPDPNGWDDLTAAGAMIRGEWPNKGDLAKADLADIRPFVAANEPAIDRMRLGLSRPCVAHFQDSHSGLDSLLADEGRIRSLSRLLLARARVEEADGKILDSSRSCREALALGQAVTQGSMGLGVMFGSVLQGQAVDRLRNLRDRLPADECRSIVREVEDLERRRVGIDQVDARHLRWVKGSFTARERLMLRLTGMEQKGRAAEVAMARKAGERGGRKVRFLLVELSIHAHHLDRGTWPRSVQELVPAYLAAVPIDPATGLPIEYPGNASGELTDDLAAIARPDGEVAPAGP